MTDKEALKLFIKVVAHLKELGLLVDTWDFNIAHIYDLMYHDRDLTAYIERNNLSACKALDLLETLDLLEKGGF